jgi:microcystin-dependent protein
MTPFGGATAPSGWLLCYGQAVSRTTYALLFAVIGIAYGAGDGSTTFTLPDKRGRVSIGADNMGGSAASRVTQSVSGVQASVVGSAGGNQFSQADTLTASSSANSVVSDPGHLHQYIPQTDGGTGKAAGGRAGIAAPAETTLTAFTGITVATTVTTTVSTALTGASQNMPPCQVDNVIIFSGVA